MQMVEDNARLVEIAAEAPFIRQDRCVERAARAADLHAQRRDERSFEGAAVDEDRHVARRAELARQVGRPPRVEQRRMGGEIDEGAREFGRRGFGARALSRQEIVELPDCRYLRDMPVAVQMRLDQARPAAAGHEHDRIAARQQPVEVARPGQRPRLGRQDDGRPHRRGKGRQSKRWAAHRRVT